MIKKDINQNDILNLEILNILDYNYIYSHRPIQRIKTKPTLENSLTRLENLKKTIKREASPRHVPAKIIEVSDIPRTKNGKTVELAVKNIIEGNKIKNIQALINPSILQEYKNIEELKKP